MLGQTYEHSHIIEVFRPARLAVTCHSPTAAFGRNQMAATDPCPGYTAGLSVALSNLRLDYIMHRRENVDRRRMTQRDQI